MRTLLLAILFILASSSTVRAADWGFGFSFSSGDHGRRHGAGIIIEHGRHHHPRPDCWRPIVVRPAPVVVCEPARVWIPGRYEIRRETVLVEPERVERHWVPDLIEQRIDPKGNQYEVIVRKGYWKEVVIPARYETRETRVWVEGYYVYR